MAASLCHIRALQVQLRAILGVHSKCDPFRHLLIDPNDMIAQINLYFESINMDSSSRKRAIQVILQLQRLPPIVTL